MLHGQVKGLTVEGNIYICSKAFQKEYSESLVGNGAGGEDENDIPALAENAAAQFGRDSELDGASHCQWVGSFQPMSMMVRIRRLDIGK